MGFTLATLRLSVLNLLAPPLALMRLVHIQNGKAEAVTF